MTGMDASAPAPFVNREMLAQYVTRRVRLAGAVESMDDTSITVKASDDGLVRVQLRAPSSFDDKYIMLEGVVDSPDTIIEDSHCNFGNSFDMQKYNEMCKLSNGPYRALFVGQ